MDEEQNILGTDLADNGDHGFGLWCPEPKCDVRAERLFSLLKCTKLKLALDGADKAIKDWRILKPDFTMCEARLGSSSEHGELRRSSLYSSEKNANEERRDKAKTPSQESERVCKKSANPLLHSSKDFVPLSSYNPFPFNILAYIVVLMMKIIGFQLTLVLSFFTSPIRLSYFSFMLLLFPFQTLRRIRGYLMKKLLPIWSVTSTNVTLAVSEHVKSQNSLAVNVGLAFFRSIYVCSMLFGILASGSVLGGFIMRHLVVKPIQTTENLNFDYTKSSPVAFVPLMLSSGVGSDRVIPYRHKLQLAVSLTLPESE